MRAIDDGSEWQQAHVSLGELLEAAPDPMVSFQADGQIRLVNSQLEQLFGYSRQELVGRPIEILLAKDCRESHKRLRSAFFGRPRAHSRLDLYGRRKDGLEFPAEISFSALHTADDGLVLISTVRDITERAQAKSALEAAEGAQQRLENLMAAMHRTESQFRATFEQAAAGMAHVALDGHWLRVNQRLCEIVGYSKDELLQRTFQDITHPDDLDADLER